MILNWLCVVFNISGTLNAELYHTILRLDMMKSAKDLFGDELFKLQDGKRDWYLCQDNDRKHKARLNMRYLEKKKVNVLDWPSYSPDLNPIENLWSILDYEAKNRNARNLEQMKECICTAWVNIPEGKIHRLVASMPTRLRKVIAAKGRHLDY